MHVPGFAGIVLDSSIVDLEIIVGGGLGTVGVCTIEVDFGEVPLWYNAVSEKRREINDRQKLMKK